MALQREWALDSPTRSDKMLTLRQWCMIFKSSSSPRQRAAMRIRNVDLQTDSGHSDLTRGGGEVSDALDHPEQAVSSL